MRATVGEPFWARAAKTDGCWDWTAARGSNGYGQSWYEGRAQPAHRVAWTLTYGPIPDGLWVLHHCDNRLCVRPEHLFLGDNRANQLDALRKGRQVTQTHRAAMIAAHVVKTHCKRGHPLSGENLRITSANRRVCLTCKSMHDTGRAEQHRAYRERKRVAHA